MVRTVIEGKWSECEYFESFELLRDEANPDCVSGKRLASFCRNIVASNFGKLVVFAALAILPAVKI
jgi:hypothetical protein